MWPWDHLAFGYLVYVVIRQSRPWAGPDDATALTLAIGSQLPDIVDKPLAWSVGVLPSGLSLGHSLLFVVLATSVARVAAARIGRKELSTVLAIGLITHLLGDALFAVIVGSPRTVEFVFWPFIPAIPEDGNGLLLMTTTLWAKFISFLSTSHGQWFLVGDAVLLATAVGTWYRDGAPGTIWLQRWLHR